MTTAFIYQDNLSRHSLGDTHPMKPSRLRYTYELLVALQAFEVPNSLLVSARKATTKEILSFHSSEYISAVATADGGNLHPNSSKFNLGSSDNPIYEGIYQAALLSTGSTMRAVELILNGTVESAFSISGGLHHAMPHHASGFCIFNDPVIAIKAFLDNDLRVAYIDIDCHHGDGVQYAFYDSDRVLNISIHESGEFLFPGTGFVNEIGSGKGRGYTINIPLYPYTNDEEYLWAFREIVPRIMAKFRPDILVTQQGVDSHFQDPITHLNLTTQGHSDIVKEIKSSHNGPWLALGGGGYNLQAVARSWALEYGIMSGQHFGSGIPESYSHLHNVDSLIDHRQDGPPQRVKNKILKYNTNTVNALQKLLSDFP